MATLARYERERRLLQILLTAVAAIPLGLGGIITLTGLVGMSAIFGLHVPIDPSLDSNVRFLAANFFGMGMVMVWTARRIEARTATVRIFAVTVGLGATARLISLLQHGDPGALVLALIGVEYSAVLFALWQARVARMAKELGRLS